MLVNVTLGGLSDALAGEVRRRVAVGELTGAGLAARTLLAQSTVANWLRGHRRLSASACDCVLAALHLDLVEVLRGGLLDGLALPRPRQRVVTMPARPEAARLPAAVERLGVAA